ncbi:hypothetical protein PMI22_00484 [Pseudomonas sp. GM21]|uniref:hypothetical protein n=1 Tax=Pseudomonas sp. GM21 TaxID=1144325 RepID=UPI0002722EBC|nr:hypothetical protein [Pseudomonas sp. GM21]EJM25138.1 hypothetical protein PMI22_00484 [Pseudomonas sp. GM21]
MSLLSGLLDHIPPTLADAAKPAMVNRTTDHARLVLVEHSAQLPASTYTNAANATPGWRHARDQYLNHIMTCRACCAPTARYCLAGADLRAIYDRIPMELNQ